MMIDCLVQATEGLAQPVAPQTLEVMTSNVTSITSIKTVSDYDQQLLIIMIAITRGAQ